MPTVRVSSKGQIVIPKPLRDKLRLRRGSLLRVELDGSNLLLSPSPEWRKLYGAAKGADLLKALRQERQAEIKRDQAAL